MTQYPEQMMFVATVSPPTMYLNWTQLHTLEPSMSRVLNKIRDLNGNKIKKGISFPVFEDHRKTEAGINCKLQISALRLRP